MTPKLSRYEKNPLLLPTKNNWESRSVLNAGVAIFNKNVVLLYRAQGEDKVSRLGLAVLEEGVRVKERSGEPVFSPDPASEYETQGVEDPRVTEIDGVYYIAYTGASLYPPLIPGTSAALRGLPGGEIPWRVRVSLAHTSDFKIFTRRGVIINHIDSKDAALFPRQFAKQYVLLHRVYPQVRLAVSGDLQRFKERGVYIWPRPGEWDGERVGAGAPPLETPYGWLLFYHAVDNELVYRLGLIISDLNDPSKILVRCDAPILEPEESYEKKGDVPNVVFTCGAVEWKDQFLVYYGAADTVLSLATITKADLYGWIEGELQKKKSDFELAGVPER